MEPVTHMLTGACLSRALGFPSKARYATAACVIAAELPDADYLYRLGGPILYFQHHRGWTHALWSLPLQAAVVTLCFFMAHKTRRRWKRRRSAEEPAPARWGLLFGMCLLALLSHILLDWTNNYGVRPFAPWNPRWFAGDLVFIVEPLLLLFLGGALLLPLLLSLVHGEMGIRRARYPGRGLAAAALVLVAGLWCFRAMQHGDAVLSAEHQDYRGGRAMRLAMNPYPVNPYRWSAVVQTPGTLETGSFDTRTGAFDGDTMRSMPIPASTPAVMAAKRSWLGRVYLDWSRFPVVEEMGTAEQVHPEMDLDPAERSLRVVRFTDLRFGYPVLGMGGGSSAPLAAEAWVDGAMRVRRQFFGAAEQTLP